MARSVHFELVRYANHGLEALFDNESRTGRDSIIANERGISLVGVNLLRELFLDELIELNGLARDGMMVGRLGRP